MREESQVKKRSGVLCCVEVECSVKKDIKQLPTRYKNGGPGSNDCRGGALSKDESSDDESSNDEAQNLGS